MAHPRVCLIGTFNKETYIINDVLSYFTERYGDNLLFLEHDAKDRLKKLIQFDPEVVVTPHHGVDDRKMIKRCNSPRVIVVDHGIAFLKNYLSNRKYFSKEAYLFVSNEIRKRLIQTRDKEDRGKVITGGYIRAPVHMAPPVHNREEFFRLHDLDETLPLVVYARTLIDANCPGMMEDVKEAYKELEGDSSKYNLVDLPHLQGASVSNTLKKIKNEGSNIVETLKHADVIISDTSSVLFEAAAHGKRLIQMIYREYSKNSSKGYHLPKIAIVKYPFYIGWLTKPDTILQTIDAVIEDPHIYDAEFAETISHIGEMSGTMNPNVMDNLFSVIEMEEPQEIHDDISPLSEEEYQETMGYPKSIRNKRKGEIITLVMINDLEILKEISGSTIIAGVSPVHIDEVKGYPNIYDVFIYRSIKLRRHYIHKYQADELILSKSDNVEDYSDLCEVKFV